MCNAVVTTQTEMGRKYSSIAERESAKQKLLKGLRLCRGQEKLLLVSDQEWRVSF